MAVTQSLTLTQQSQSIVNNYSIVKLLWTSTQSGESWNGYTRTANYWVSINGGAETKYSVSYTLPKNSTKTIAEVNITVPHRSDGTGSISVRTWMDTDISAGEITKTASLTLAIIPRMTTMTVGNGTLGTSQNLTFTKQSSGFTHSVSWKCGTAEGTICTKISGTSTTWTPSIELASQNATGDTVSVVFTITTYNGSTTIGTTTATATYHIPDNIAPYYSISKTDENGHLDKYGAFVQGQSRLTVELVDVYSSYGAWITGYKMEFDGKVYTSQSFTSDAIVKSGNVPLIISVTDSRGRTTVTNDMITVLTYQEPKIVTLSAVRCDKNSNPDNAGEYLLVSYGWEAISLNSLNSAECVIQYKKVAEETYTTHNADFDTYDNGVWLHMDGDCTIPADPSYSYDILLTVKDDFKSSKQATVGASGKKVFSALKQDGDVVGWAFGKSAELPGVFDVGWQARFSGGTLHPVLPTDTDINTLLTPATFMLLSANSYTNTPESGVGAFLEIVGIKDTSLIQRYSVFSGTNPRVWERPYYAGSWQPWVCVRGDFVVEQGEKDGWTYRKWNSGIGECWKILTHTTALTTAWGSMYCGAITSRQTYPFPFTSKPVENVTLLNGGSAAWICAETGSAGGVNGAYASATYTMVRPTAVAETQTFYLSFHVSGKWK